MCKRHDGDITGYSITVDTWGTPTNYVCHPDGDRPCYAILCEAHEEAVKVYQEALTRGVARRLSERRAWGSKV